MSADNTITLYGRISPSIDDGLIPRDSQYVVTVLLAAGLTPKSIQFLDGRTLVFWFKKEDVERLGLPASYKDFNLRYGDYVSASDEWRARLATGKRMARGGMN